MDPAASPVSTRPADAGVLLTAAELESHRQALARLVEVRDRDLPQLLRHARTFVASDAAEEIVQLQEDQAVLEARIGRLEELLRDAHVVADDGAATGVVSVGCLVEVEYVRSGKRVAYRVIGTAVPAGTGSLSAGSPVGQALLGHAAGDTVTAALPNGRVERLRVLSVRPGEAAPWH
jgi:transcription elongation factor GreA